MEPKVLHACEGVCSLSGASFGSNTHVVSSLDAGAKRPCCIHSFCLATWANARMDQRRHQFGQRHGLIAHRDFILSGCEGETKSLPSIPHRPRSRAPPFQLPDICAGSVCVSLSSGGRPKQAPHERPCHRHTAPVIAAHPSSVAPV